MAQNVMIIVMLLFSASISAILLKKIKFPYTIGLVLVGILLSYICDKSGLDTSNIKLTPDLILYILLPTLIFEASVNIDTRSLMKNLVPSMILAAPGLVIATVITGAAVYFLTPLDLGGAMLFGALISATDPVAVIGLFKELGAPKRLTMLVDAESLFNDATAIVMFNIVRKIAWGVAGTSAAISMSTCAIGAKDFVVVFLAGLLIGALIGFIMTFIIAKGGNEPLIQVALTTIVAYTAFIVSDKLGYSGVMSAVGAGLVISYYSKTHLSKEVKQYLGQFWEFSSFLANSFIFLLLGFTENLLLLETAESKSWFIYIIWAIVAVLVARAVVVFALCPLIGALRKSDRIEWRYQLIMFWGGLRGAVPMALVLSLPHDFENRQLLVALTLGIVLFTLLIQGTTVKLLIRKLGLDRPDAFTLGVTTVARLAAAEKGLARLEALETAEKFPDRIINELRQTYDAKIKDRRAALENLRNTPEFESGTIRKNLWIESLSVMRSGYNQLDDRGLLSAYTYRDLLSISDQHIDIVLAAGYLPESSRWSDAGLICVKRNIIQRIVDLLHWKNLTRRVKLGRMAHELEKYFSIYYGSHRVLTMLESSKAIYGDYQEMYEDCKKYFQALNKMSSERMDIMKKRDTEEMQIATRNILQRVIYDAELSELEAMKDNGFITEALADCMISEIEEKIDLTKHKAV